MIAGHGLSFKINSMNYKVLARKYRPQDFKELIGQEILVNTLKKFPKKWPLSSLLFTNRYKRCRKNNYS